MLEILFQVIARITRIVTPIFVFIVLLNAGMKDHPKDIWSIMRTNKMYYLRLGFINCLLIPLLVWTILIILPLRDTFSTGIIIFFLCAGAPIVISYVSNLGSSSVYATGGMMLQLILSVALIPILLPTMLLLANLNLNQLIQNLFYTVVIPLCIGFAIGIFFTKIKVKVANPLKLAQKITMDMVIYGTLITNIPAILSLVGEFAITTGMILVFLSFFLGWAFERKNSNVAMKETTAFYFGQRNYAIASLIASYNFGSEVMLATTIVYAISLLQMKILGKILINRKNKKAIGSQVEF